jgi:hypothetical protein
VVQQSQTVRIARLIKELAAATAPPPPPEPKMTEGQVAGARKAPRRPPPNREFGKIKIAGKAVPEAVRANPAKARQPASKVASSKSGHAPASGPKVADVQLADTRRGGHRPADRDHGKTKVVGKAVPEAAKAKHTKQRRPNSKLASNKSKPAPVHHREARRTKVASSR